MNKYDQVVKEIEAGKTKNEIIKDANCSSSYLRFVKRKLADPEKVKTQNNNLKMTGKWKKRFSEEWEEACSKIL